MGHQRCGPASAALAARERIVITAYALFTRRGVRAVGIDEIISQPQVAKATMYRLPHQKRSRVGASSSNTDDQPTGERIFIVPQ